MNRTESARIDCTVENPANLPAELGGPDAVCAAIEKAALPALQSAGIAPSELKVSVKAQSSHQLSATASAGSFRIAEQKVGISDRALNRRAVDMLARAIASELEKLGR